MVVSGSLFLDGEVGGMHARQNTKITITRTVSQDPWGMPAPGANTPAATHVPASLNQRSRSVFNESSSAPRVITWAVLRVNGNTVLLEGDRILDERTGIHWVVDEVSNFNVAQPLSLGKRATLRSV